MKWPAAVTMTMRRAERPKQPAWRRALWIALAVNAAIFAAEMSAGVAAGSPALQADALDFLGDAANYAISLGVAGLALAWRPAPPCSKASPSRYVGPRCSRSTVWQLSPARSPQRR